ncbi:MAG: Piwi domain-containing protein [Candidatus Heimdallarchaeaceae archaeon]
MKLISTVYQIKEEYIPIKLYLTKVSFDEKKIREMYASFVYSQVSILSYKLSKKNRLVAASGTFLVSEEPIDKDEIEKSFGESDKLYSDFYKDADKPKALFSGDKNWLSYCKPYVHRKIKQLLLDNKYIPVHFFEKARKQASEWHLVSSVEDERSKIIEISLPSFGRGQYKIRRGLRIQLVDDEQRNLYLKTDVKSAFFSELTLLDLMKLYLDERSLTYEDIRKNSNYQKEIEAWFWRRNPALKPTYEFYSETGKPQQNCFFVSFDWDLPITEYPGGKGETVYEYHKKRGRILKDKEQPLVLVRFKRNQKPWPYPIELIKESPDYRFFKRIGVSEEVLNNTKIQEFERLLIAEYLIFPLKPILKNVPIEIEGFMPENLLRIERTNKGPNETELYSKRTMNYQMMEMGDFEKVAIIYPDVTLLTPKQEDTLNEMINNLQRDLTKTLTINKVTTKEKINEHLNLRNCDGSIKSLESLFAEFSANDYSLLTIIVSSKTKYDWLKIKELSIRYKILTQVINFENYQDSDKDSKPFYIRNTIYQMVFKCGGIPYYVQNLAGKPGYLYLGLDCRQASDEKAGVRAGTCLFLPNGKYLMGMIGSTFDGDKSDFINPEAIITPEIKEKIRNLIEKNEVKHLVILRDGGYTKDNLPGFIENELKAIRRIAKDLKISYSYVTVNKKENHRFYNFTSSNQQYLSRDFPDLWEDLDIKGILTDPQNTRLSRLNLSLKRNLRKLSIDLVVEPPIAIKSPYRNDSFYLMTTRPTRGTATSISYTVLETQLNTDELIEQLIGDLVALSRCVHETISPTRIPSPVFYADKLANWIAKVGKTPPQEFNTKVFYA